MKHKVSELEGGLLDVAVAMAAGYGSAIVSYRVFVAWAAANMWSPSANWMDAGPIIERERIDLTAYGDGEEWCAELRHLHDVMALRRVEAYGPTPLVAAMRAFVLAKLGDEVELP